MGKDNVRGRPRPGKEVSRILIVSEVMFAFALRLIVDCSNPFFADEAHRESPSVELRGFCTSRVPSAKSLNSAEIVSGIPGPQAVTHLIYSYLQSLVNHLLSST